MLMPAGLFPLFRSTRWAVPAALVPAVAVGLAGAHEDSCVTGTCWDCFTESLLDCQAAFPTANDETLRNICVHSVGLAYLACNSTVDREELSDIWHDLYIRLQECNQLYGNPISLKICTDFAMEEFRRRLDALNDPDPDDQGCRDGVVDVESGQAVYTFRDVIESEETNRAQPVYITRSVGETITLASAGVGVTYNVSQMPCVHSVHLLATYQTKDGVVTTWVDHDMDPSDGAPLEMYLHPSTLVHADTVYLSAMFMDADGMPVMIETGLVLIADSPLTGDYNRDESADANDLLDYIDGYAETLRRADLNANGQVESSDLNEFVSDLGAGL